MIDDGEERSGCSQQPRRQSREPREPFLALGRKGPITGRRLRPSLFSLQAVHNIPRSASVTPSNAGLQHEVEVGSPGAVNAAPEEG